MFRYLVLWVWGCVCLSSWSGLSAQADPLFESQELLTLTLTVHIDALQGDRGEESDYHPALIAYTSASGGIELPVKVKSRGNFRRDPEHCFFPPLRLNFDKDDTDGTAFEGQDKIKLVTHCGSDEFIHKEYLVYRIFNLLSDSSFRVRLARITYQDAAGVRAPETHFAFFVESDEALAARIRCEELSTDEIEEMVPLSADSAVTLRIRLFAYLIGNRDWDISLRKNIKLFQRESQSPVVAVPYDFDFCGAVMAPYTFVNVGGDSRLLQEREWGNYCPDSASLERELAFFRAKRSRIIALYANYPYLRRSQLRDPIRFLTRFYDQISRSSHYHSLFRAQCE